MEKDFEVIDHTADVGVIAYGADLDQAFANAARALFSLIAEPDDIAEALHRDLELAASDQEDLLVTWLNELIYLFDTEHLLFKRFEVSVLGDRLKARAYGEKVDSSRHRLKTGVKGATYHMLGVSRNDSGCKVRVILDI
ncbi:MAG: archease [Dehalococcoidales bacterium]|nr:archease [Dehalococcoidales bacterium]